MLTKERIPYDTLALYIKADKANSCSQAINTLTHDKSVFKSRSPCTPSCQLCQPPSHANSSFSEYKNGFGHGDSQVYYCLTLQLKKNEQQFTEYRSSIVSEFMERCKVDKSVFFKNNFVLDETILVKETRSFTRLYTRKVLRYKLGAPSASSFSGPITTPVQSFIQTPIHNLIRTFYLKYILYIQNKQTNTHTKIT